jgi:hypothetical protein
MVNCGCLREISEMSMLPLRGYKVSLFPLLGYVCLINRNNCFYLVSHKKSFV